MPVDLNAMLQDSMMQLANTPPADSVKTTQAMTQALVTGAAAANAATQRQADVQVDAATKAEMLQAEAADRTLKTSNDVLAMWETTRQATAASVEQTKNYLLEASALDAEAQQLGDNAPSLFSNPLGAITAKWKSASKQVEAEEKRATAHRMATSINSVLQMSRVQMEDTLAAQNMATSAHISKMATTLDDGIAQARIAAEANLQQVNTLNQTNKDIYAVQRNHQSWWQEQQSLLLRQQDADMRAKEFALNKDKWDSDKKQRELFERNLNNVAYTIALTRNGNKEPTPTQIIAARAMAEGLAEKDPATFGQFSMYGNELKELGSTLGFASAIRKGSVGLLQSLGTISGNAQFANIGNSLTTNAYARVLEDKYQARAREAGIDPTNKQAYETFKRGLGSGEKTAMEKDAQKIAQTMVTDMPISSYLSDINAQYGLTNTGIKTVALGNPQSVQEYYGYAVGSKENAALANPQFRAIVDNAQANGGQNATVAGAAAAYDFLKQAGVKNPYKIVAKIMRLAQEGTATSDNAEYKFLRQFVPLQGKAVLKLDDNSYDMADPVWAERAILRYKNPKPTVLGRAQNAVSDLMFKAGGNPTPYAEPSRTPNWKDAVLPADARARGEIAPAGASIDQAIAAGLDFKSAVGSTRQNLINSTSSAIEGFAPQSDAIRAERAAKLQAPQAQPVRRAMAADGSIVDVYADGTTNVVQQAPSGNAPRYNLQTLPTPAKPQPVPKAQPAAIPDDVILRQETLSDGSIMTVYKSGRTNFKAPPLQSLQAMPEQHLRNLLDE